MDDTWPLVGRREELSLIASLLHGGAAAGVVVSGAAGVGKTRLLAEVRALAEGVGCVTASVSATRAAASIPFGAFAPLLPTPGSGNLRWLDLLQRAAGALGERAGGRRLVIAVDDAHMLDPASAALVHQLAATGAAFMVVAVRRGEPAQDPIAALWKDGLARHLELRELTPAEVEELLRGVLGGDVDGSTVLALWRSTQGNPLFLHELVLEGSRRGILSQPGDIWRWSGPLAPGARLLALVEARLHELRRAEREALELVAFGEPIGAGVATRLVEPGALEALERQGLVAVERSGRRADLRLAHPLYGDVVRASMPALRERALAGRLADAIEEAGMRRRDDLLRVAAWRLESGGAVRPELLVAAAWRALASFDAALAQRAAAAAYEASRDVTAGHALGLALTRQGLGEESERVLAEVEELAVDGPERAAVAGSRANNLFFRLARVDEAERVLLTATAAVVQAELRSELALARATYLLFSGRPADAIEVVSPILDNPDCTERLGVFAAPTAVLSLAVAGRVDRAAAVSERWRYPLPALGGEYPFSSGRVVAALCLAQVLGGRLQDAAAEAERSYQSALRTGDHEGIATMAGVRGYALLVQGRPRMAIRWLREAVALYRELDMAGLRPWCLGFLAQAAALVGDTHEARVALEEAEALRRPNTAIAESELGLALVWIEAADGQLSAARTRALAVAADAESSGALAYAVLALHDVVRLGDADRVVQRLGALSAVVEGPLAPACCAHAVALAAEDGIALDRSAAGFETIGAQLLAAEAFAEAAAAHHAAGRPARASAATARSRVLSDLCEGARTPALLSAGPAIELTRREREVAALAASGRSNREIGAGLSVSIRTVENHLQNVYAKLGVSDRTRLADLLGPPHTPED